MKKQIFKVPENKNELYRLILEKYKSCSEFAKKNNVSRELVNQFTNIEHYKNKKNVEKGTKQYYMIKDLGIEPSEYIKLKATPCKYEISEKEKGLSKFFENDKKKYKLYYKTLCGYFDGTLNKIKMSYIDYISKVLKIKKEDVINKMVSDFKYEIPERVKKLKKNKSEILKNNRYNNLKIKNDLTKFIKEKGYTTEDIFSVLDTVKEKNKVNCGRRFHNYFIAKKKNDMDCIIHLSILKELSFLLDIDCIKVYNMFYKKDKNK